MANRNTSELDPGVQSTSTLSLSAANMKAPYDEVQYSIKGLPRGGSWTPTCPDPSVLIDDLAIALVFPGDPTPGVSTRAISNNLCQTIGNWYWITRGEITTMSTTVLPVSSNFHPEKIGQFKSFRPNYTSFFYTFTNLQTTSGTASRTRWGETGAPFTSTISPIGDTRGHIGFLDFLNSESNRVVADYQITQDGYVADTQPVNPSLFSPQSYTAYWSTPGWSRISCADLVPIGTTGNSNTVRRSGFLDVGNGFPQPGNKIDLWSALDTDPTPASIVVNIGGLSGAMNSTTQPFAAYNTPMASAWEINTEDPSNG